jgi:hypothetical protein
VITSILPTVNEKATKINATYKQPNVHTVATLDVFKVQQKCVQNDTYFVFRHILTLIQFLDVTAYLLVVKLHMASTMERQILPIYIYIHALTLLLLGSSLQ